MNTLKTNYLGLTLKNPVIVSSSGLSSTPEKVKKLAENGAGAVILKSLFEEQINHEAGSLISDNSYPEASDYILSYSKDNSIGNYLNLIKESKKIVDIPVIASINCTGSTSWTSFAKKIEEAGADALEINVYFLPNDIDKTSEKYESIYIKLAEKLKESVNIPISFKLGAFFTNPANLAKELYYRKVDSLVLFNRFYAPDIDIDNFRMTTSDVFSSPADIRNTLRWTGILSDKLPKMQLSASTGIHTGKDAIKMILSGATTVQVCSSLYKNGIEQLNTIITEIENWMKKNNFNNLDEFRGKMSYKNIPNPAMYERSQFMKHFSNHE